MASDDIFITALMGGIVLVTFLMVAIVIFRGIRKAFTNKPASMPSKSSAGYSSASAEPNLPQADGVLITESGRTGSVIYRENGNTCRFYWEFLGSDAIVGVTFPKKAKWDETYPWAAGRQDEIMKIVAAEVIRQKAPGHKVRWADGSFDII